MATVQYLAMTGAEMGRTGNFPFPVAWMACHFSPYGLGLSNLPRQLPPGSIVMLDDITPIRGHDPRIIAEQLAACVEELGCCAVLLDFQRPGYSQAEAFAQALTKALPCPVCVSSLYAGSLSCPVLVPPAPCHLSLEAHLAPWKGREIWLELSREAEQITLTDRGAAILPCPVPESEGFREEDMHCHYFIDCSETEARFTLWRTREDQTALLKEAEALGIPCAVGLYQEFSAFCP